MVNPKALPHEELIVTGVALGIIQSFTDGQQMDRQELEQEVERRQPEERVVFEDDQYGEFDFR